MEIFAGNGLGSACQNTRKDRPFACGSAAFFPVYMVSGIATALVFDPPTTKGLVKMEKSNRGGSARRIQMPRAGVGHGKNKMA
jgi:hypothetical protein